jgi:homoserine kinase type II
LEWQGSLAVQHLPRGVIHGDLFRDNVLFEGGEVSGLLDWYNAGHDLLLLDLAITLNDWCHQDDGSLDLARSRALLRGYGRERPLAKREAEMLPAMLRAGALRFWLSRLRDRHFPRDGAMTFQKDPEWFRRMLLLRREEGESLLAGLW